MAFRSRGGYSRAVEKCILSLGLFHYAGECGSGFRYFAGEGGKDG